jgi:hypothetical protein
MTYTYATYKTAIANELVVLETDTDFLAILPSLIDYAEQRMYRELDLLNTVTRQTGTLTSNDRDFTLPSTSGRFVTTQGINIITPSSQTVPNSGTRNQCFPTSRDYLDNIWPSTTGAGVPQFYAMITDQTVIFGPFPDATYTAEVIGTIRPTPLSVSNTTTYLTLYLPDAFFSAGMIFGSGWQKNFGAQADDPKMSTSWESQYQTLMGSANIEEQRKRYATGAWSSMSPTPLATASRP